MLHIGGARTALFNLLFARRHGGKYLLRVEDTDKERSTQEAVDAIFDGLNWLGLNSDADPVMQSARIDRHVECAQALVHAGEAFRCYATPEDLQARRDEGEAKRQAAKSDGLDERDRARLRAEADALLSPFRSPWRDVGDPPAPDAPYTVRLRAPDDGDLVLADAVQGEIRIRADEIDDLVLLRADGTPTYMLAVVVDDHDMGVTHVIRGDDHLRNAFRQIPIYRGLGWATPVFAHVPMIHGPDGAKLSKRHGATGVQAYRDMGYLPEAMVNYLARLGWSFGDREIFSADEAAEAFDLGQIGRAPARLDFDKLAALNAHYIRTADDTRLFGLLADQFAQSGGLSPVQETRVRAALPDMKERGATIPELAEAFAFLRTERPLELTGKARKAVKGDALDHLAALRNLLRTIEPWGADLLKPAIDGYCEEAGVSMGRVGPPLRAALTGGLPAPDIGQVLDWLGREEALGRVDDVINAAR